jgi:4-hydroxy-2-oxoheptanedioate aldolase
MNGAELKATLQAGGRVFGTMISLGRNPRWIPILSDVGLDYVIIDTEHSPRSRGELGDYLAMFNTTGVVPIVRIPIPDSHYVTMAMDAGAQGVLAPYCETVDEVKEVVAAPEGPGSETFGGNR